MKPSSHQTQPHQSSKETPMDPWPAAHGSWANAWCMDQDSQPAQTNSDDHDKRTEPSSEDADEKD